MGASGSGTTTLARALADHWAVPHADADDYFWVPTTPPYSTKRAEAERVSLMEQIFAPREAWVLSGSMMGWGDKIVERCDAVVFLTVEPNERLRRIEQREQQRRQSKAFDKVSWDEFLEWARGYDDPTFTGRSRVAHEEWLATLRQPVLRLDSAASPAELVQQVLAWQPPEAAERT